MPSLYDSIGNMASTAKKRMQDITQTGGPGGNMARAGIRAPAAYLARLATGSQEPMPSYDDLSAEWTPSDFKPLGQAGSKVMSGVANTITNVAGDINSPTFGMGLMAPAEEAAMVAKMEKQGPELANKLGITYNGIIGHGSKAGPYMMFTAPVEGNHATFCAKDVPLALGRLSQVIEQLAPGNTVHPLWDKIKKASIEHVEE